MRASRGRRFLAIPTLLLGMVPAVLILPPNGVPAVRADDGPFQQVDIGPLSVGGQVWSVDSTYRYIWLEKIESQDQNIVDKKYNDNGHMVTIGINFHF